MFRFFFSFKIDDILYSIPPSELPSLDAVMNEIDSDIDSINSSVLADKTNYTPTPSLDLKLQSGSILRHVIFQGVTAQIGSAAVRLKKIFNFILILTVNLRLLGPNRSWLCICNCNIQINSSRNFTWFHINL